MKIVVDRVQCAGLGICEAQSPGTFELDESGEVVILNENVDPDRLDEIRDTVASCPTKALSLVEDLLPPLETLRNSSRSRLLFPQPRLKPVPRSCAAVPSC